MTRPRAAEIPDQAGAIILVGHSYGGAVVIIAATRDRQEKALVSAAAADSRTGSRSVPIAGVSGNGSREERAAA
jgi:pimeloyl-ACP methyl ester carboxylesterase